MLRKADVFMIAAIVWMTCFSFLRTSYNDTGTYIAHFMDSESVADYFARNGLLDWTGNPLSELYRDAMRDITTNYHIYFFFPAFLSSFAVVNELTKQLRQAKLEKEKLMDAESDMTALQTRDLIDLLEGGPEFLDSFDAELFGELVEKIIIESNDSVRFCLKNGLELQESIERTVR